MSNKEKTFKEMICELGVLNQEKTIDFLYNHQYTTVQNLQKLLGIALPSVYTAINRYAAKGIVKKIEFNDAGVKGSFIGLTLNGIYIHSEKHNIEPNEKAVLYPSNINLSSITHNMKIQDIHITLYKKDQNIQFFTERNYAYYNINFQRKNNNGIIKNTIVPDAIAIFNNEKIAIEAELYPKNTDKYKSILSRHMHSASRGLYEKVLYAIPKNIYNSLSTRIKETAIHVDKNSINKNSNIADRLIFMEL